MFVGCDALQTLGVVLGRVWLWLLGNIIGLGQGRVWLRVLLDHGSSDVCHCPGHMVLDVACFHCCLVASMYRLCL